MKIMQVIDYDTFKDDCVKTAKMCSSYADIIWFRIKGRDDIYQQAKKLREALPEAYLCLSKDPDIAYGLGYEAVQLSGKSDIAEVRRRYPSLKIGYSAHTKEEIAEKDADFFTLSPVFFTVKNYEVKPIGVSSVSELGKVIYALGGINADNVGQLKGMGYTGVAGISFFSEIDAVKKAVLS
ncbi:MAG: hypothetical protein C0602_03745 [Denitrovibrio sp.]|nr:MAG: hypothetical protein C0602_03745 [Denitrovibrio sp.]